MLAAVPDTPVRTAKKDPPAKGDPPTSSGTRADATKSKPTTISPQYKIDRVQAACSLVAANNSASPDEVWVSVLDPIVLYDFVAEDEFGDLVAVLTESFLCYKLLCTHIASLCREYDLEYDAVCRSTNWYDVHAYAQATKQDLLFTMRGRLEYWYQHEYQPPTDEKHQSASKKKTTKGPTAAYRPSDMTEQERERMAKFKSFPDGSLRKTARKEREKGNREKAQEKARDKSK